jgi:hypothetical protein
VAVVSANQRQRRTGARSPHAPRRTRHFAQRVGDITDARDPWDDHDVADASRLRKGRVMHLAIQQTAPALATVAAGWLMVRMGVTKGLIVLRAPSRCPACGRRRTHGRCRCVDGA